MKNLLKTETKHPQINQPSPVDDIYASILCVLLCCVPLILCRTIRGNICFSFILLLLGNYSRWGFVHEITANIYFPFTEYAQSQNSTTVVYKVSILFSAHCSLEKLLAVLFPSELSDEAGYLWEYPPQMLDF